MRASLVQQLKGLKWNYSYFKQVHIFSIQIWQTHVTAIDLILAIPAK